MKWEDYLLKMPAKLQKSPKSQEVPTISAFAELLDEVPNEERAMMMKRKRVKSPEVEAVGAEDGEHKSDADLLVAISEEAELFHTPRGESYPRWW